MVGLLLVGFWTAFGALSCSLLAARKGHDELEWTLLGAALGPIGLVALARSPNLEPISYLVSDPRLPALVECPSCRRVVAIHLRCSSCEEPIPGAPRPRRQLVRRLLRLGQRRPRRI